MRWGASILPLIKQKKPHFPVKNQLLTSEDGPTAPDQVCSKPQGRAARDHLGPDLEKSTHQVPRPNAGEGSRWRQELWHSSQKRLWRLEVSPGGKFRQKYLPRSIKSMNLLT